MVNAAWVAAGVAALVSVPLATAWALLTRPAAPDAPAGYAAAVRVFAAAALLEALAEPLAARALAAQHYRTRLRVEGAAAVVRCALSYALVAAVCPRVPALAPLVALALGQLAFGAALVAGYAVAGAGRAGAGSARPTRPVLSAALWRLLGAYAWQAAQKVVLQEGEKLVLAVCGAARAVGADVAAVYAVVNNLASLVVRFVFLPLEEVCFTAFGRLAAAGDARAACRVLRAVLRFAVLVGLAFVAFGPGYARAVVHVLYGAKYSRTAAPTVLAWYCVYILFLALNGTSEAFVHSVASEAQLRTSNALLVVFSILFVAAAAILLRIQALAAVGLVLANCFSLFPHLFPSSFHFGDHLSCRWHWTDMLLRVVYSFFFIARWQREKLGDSKDDGARVSFLRVLPSKTVLVALLCALCGGLVSDRCAPSLVVHIAFGCLMFGGFLFVVFVVVPFSLPPPPPFPSRSHQSGVLYRWKKEKDLLAELQRMWLGKSE